VDGHFNYGRLLIYLEVPQMNILAPLFLALACMTGQVASISNGTVGVTYVDTRGVTDQPDQTISTTIEDPNHPGEPWTVITYRRKDESFEAFVKRHKDMVEAVRKALS
jgi:hypothetical protein